MNVSQPLRYRGRFAPSDTGPLHKGSLFVAVASWLDARHNDGEWLLRIDNLDTQRSERNAETLICRALERYGLQWDKSVIHASDYTSDYRAAFCTLKDAERLFCCDCSRKKLKATGPVYPGTCRHRHPAPREGAWRIFIDKVGNSADMTPDRDQSSNQNPISTRCEINDRLFAQQRLELSDYCGDFIVWRRDNLPAYPLAAVVADNQAGMTDIIRGADLLENSLLQSWLIEQLGFMPPNYGHLPVLCHANGQKLSKQHHAKALPNEEMQSREVLHETLCLLSLNPPGELQREPCPVQLDWAKAHWNWQTLSPARSISLPDLPATKKG